MKRVKITVTREDIRRGRPGESRYCPVALAAKRKIDPDSIEASPGHLVCGRIVKTPAEVADFIYSYDHGLPVKPFSFTVLVPEELVRKGERRAGK